MGAEIIIYISIAIMILLMLDLITGFSILYWVQTRIFRMPKNQMYEQARKERKAKK